MTGARRRHPRAARPRSLGFEAAFLAHDLNNMISGILFTAEGALGRDGLDGALADDIQLIRRNAKRGARLLRTLVDGEPARTPGQAAAVALDEVVADVWPLLRAMMDEQGTLALDNRCPAQFVAVDPMPLERVLTNLVKNAREAMPPGGAVTVEIGQAVVSGPADENGPTLPRGCYATIAVIDNGAGLDPAIRAHLFEPFATTKRQNGGRGLGLASVRGIVEAAGGGVSADSVAGKGSRFTIYLPLAAPQSDAANFDAHERSAPKRPGGDPRVVAPEGNI